MGNPDPARAEHADHRSRMSPLAPRHRRRSVLVVACLATLACTPQSPDPPPRYERLGLTPVGDARAEEPGPSPLRLEVADEVEGWTVHADRSRVRSLPDAPERRSLFLTGEQRLWVRIPGSFDPATFNQVAVEVYLKKGKDDVQVQFWRHGETVLQSDIKRFDGQGVVQPIFFDLLQTQREHEPYDEISVHFEGLKDEVDLLSVTLLWKPITSWLPAPDGPSEPVAIGPELRSAVALSSRRPLETELEALPDTELRIGYGIPEDVRRLDQRPLLQVTLTSLDGRGDPRVVAYPLEEELDRRARWHSASLPLGPFAPGRVQARFELRVEGKGVGVCALATPVVTHRRSDAPTVLLVTSDTHRADHVGAAHRGVEVRTPSLDALAARGVLFERCVAPANITNPSHIALMTAVHPRDTRVVNNISPLCGDARTLAEVYRDAGWATIAAISSAHLGHEQSGLGQGFDRMSLPAVDGLRDSQRDSSSAIAALEPWIDEAEGLPLFVWLHVFDAHGPYNPPESYRTLYYPAGKNPYDPKLPPVPEDRAPGWDHQVRDLAYPIALYKSEVTYLDERLGPFLARPRFQHGIVAVTADHGESLGAHGVHFEHRELYPDSLDIPLILAWPGGPRGRRVPTRVTHLDLGRTLLSLSGLQDAPFPGHDLTALGDAPPDEPRYALSAHALSAAIWAGDWFLVLHLRRHFGDRELEPRDLHEVELYDLRSDPKCLENLVDRDHERATKLRRQLVDWLVEARAEGLAVTSAVHEKAALDALVALGYATNVEEPESAWFDPDCECDWCRRFETP